MDAQYVVLDGRDTVAMELVSRCAGRIVSDVDLHRPRAHVHYEIDSLDANGFPKKLGMAIWSGADSVGGAPSQVVHVGIVGDTAVTDVWRGHDHQVQRAVSRADAFPYLWNYVGLFGQLLDVAARANRNGKPVLLLYLGTRGRAGFATKVKQTDDSLTVRIDSTEIRTAWNATTGLSGASIAGSAMRIVRFAPQALGDLRVRCRLTTSTDGRGSVRLG
jgi:hypothetical protein